MATNNSPDPLEYRYSGQHPLRTLLSLFRRERAQILFAVLIYVVKHSPMWVMPLLTANIIDVLVERQPLSQLWLNVGILLVLLLQNLPLHVFYMRVFSLSLRRVETGLRS